MLTINDIIEFENVHGKLAEDGYTYFLIDDVARELGFVDIKYNRPINNEDNILSPEMATNQINYYEG